jgi:Methyltransferase domain
VLTPKSQKELAFLHDLFIAADWSERFAGLIDSHVQLPKKGRILYAGAGTGSHVIALREQAAADVEFLGIDENDDCVALARAKVATLKAVAQFQAGRLDALDLKDDTFDLVIGDASLIAPERVPAVVSELARVAVPGAFVAIALPTSASFGEFFSIYWEALLSSELADCQVDVESLIMELPVVSDLELLAIREGLEAPATWTQTEEFTYQSGEEFITSPLISDFLMKGWLRSLKPVERQHAAVEIARLIDEERHDAAFLLTVKATLLMGRKAGVPLVG